MSRALVTGATGFVGRRLVRRLIDAGVSVTVVVRERSRLGDLQEKADRVVEADLATDTDLSDVVAEVDCVFHLAAAVKANSRDGYHSVNADGTHRVGLAVASAPQRPVLVYCSSLSAGGPSPVDEPRTEKHPAQPVSHYGRSKLAAEAVLAEFGTRITYMVVRPPIVYGPGDVEFFPVFSKLTRGGVLPTASRGISRYSLIHVDDLCEALVLAAGRALSDPGTSGGVYYVNDGVEHTMESIGEQLACALDIRPPRVVRIPVPVLHMSAWAAMTFARLRGKTTMTNVDKLREVKFDRWTCSAELASVELGFRHSVDFADGIAELAAARTGQGK